MPKYTYQCTVCNHIWSEWHSMSETTPGCCAGSEATTKLPSSFSTIQRPPTIGQTKVGEATKQGIEENREILNQMKEAARTREIDLNG